MKVSELISQLLDKLDGRNPDEVDVKLLHFNHGSDWPEVDAPYVGFQTHNDNFIITIK